MTYRWKSPGLARRLIHRIGFRGNILLMLGVVDFAYGRAFVWPNDLGTAATNRYLIDVIPVNDTAVAAWIWLMAWWVTGTFCLVNAFRRADRWGYGMAVALKIAYVGAIAIATTRGMPNGTTRMIVWTLITLFVFVESFRSEPVRDLHVVARELEETGEIPRPVERKRDRDA